jgi:lipopolysaccharide transport system ATP-binding protein
MTDIAIRVEGIGKLYRVGERESYQHLREVVAGAFRGSGNGKGRPKDTIWAVRDVSFDVHQGEVVGLIGRNGAGKSTLLKLLARITRPTVGFADIHGRIGSLLEVGTGFHYELTGRENIFLSGAILGMKRAEIRRKFDEIVAFAEVERFLDSPLKHYSSGMMMRLAFAVAAHLEPEILLIDEVLAVGDAAFQKKCLGKMQDVSRTGRTIVFVSHNMAAINALCQRCLILSAGNVDFDGATDKATTRYYADSTNVDRGSDLSGRRREGTGKARFTTLSIQSFDVVGQPLEVAQPGCDLRIDVDLECASDVDDANVAVIFYDRNGYRVIDANTAQKGNLVRLQAGQTARATFLLREVLLKPGRYLIGVWLGREGVETIDHLEYATALEFAAGEESKAHTAIYPGTYLCRFEQSVTVRAPSISRGPGSGSFVRVV